MSSYPRRRLPMLFTALFLLSACGSTQHIVDLNQAKKAFETASKASNQQVLDRLFPTPEALEQRVAEGRKSTVAAPESAPALYEKYDAASKALAKVTTEHGPALRADKLYGMALTMQLMSDWQRAYLAKLLMKESAAPDADQKQEVAVDGAAEKFQFRLAQTPSFLALRGVRDKALAEAQSGTQNVGPRDTFLLNAFDGFIRYSNALLEIQNVVGGEALAKGSQFEDRLGAVAPIIEEIAEAERVLDSVGLEDAGQVFWMEE